MKDFFVSYNGKDKEWAEWIAWQLEDAGYTTVIQAWDFRPGGNFVIDMQRAATEAERTIAVLSQNYLDAMYTQPEWTAAFAQDPTGAKKTLLPVRIQECDLKGMLSQIVYIDLVGKAQDEARKLLLDGLQTGRAKPSTAPGFPQGPSGSPTAPRPQEPPPTFPVASDWGEQFLSRAERESILQVSKTQSGGVNISDISGGSINIGNVVSDATIGGDVVGGDKVGGDKVGGDKRVINTGGGAYVEGKVDTGGGDFVGRDQVTTHSGADPNAIAEAFVKLYQALEQQPDTMQKNMTKQAVETLEAEAKKGDQADENKVKEGLEVILAMLPDIGEVAINTFINPVAGLSTAFQKIAQKARENLKNN